MNRRGFLAGLAAACPLCLSGQLGHAAGGGHRWGYEGTGAPGNWGALAKEYAACGVGRRQSPIDLANAVPADLDPAQVAWQAAQSYDVLNNGHTIQVNWPGGSAITIQGRKYDLLQFHFHHKSEHTLAGRQFPLEAHFVHKSKQGDLAVLGVFMAEGQPHPDLDAIWKVAPGKEGKAAGTAPVDPRRMLPGASPAFVYSGSLTTPPCTEIVTWTVLATPMSASAAQIAAFAKLFPKNYRPTQPLNGRFLLRVGG
ncbi:MAG: carbonic anhydrase family protein [Alphaproteobacteria bacterium]